MANELERTASPYLTASEAAAYLRFRSASGVRSAVHRRELRPARIGPRNKLLFTIEELERFLDERSRRLGDRPRRDERPGHRPRVELDSNQTLRPARQPQPTVRRTPVRRAMRAIVEEVEASRTQRDDK